MWPSLFLIAITESTPVTPPLSRKNRVTSDREENTPKMNRLKLLLCASAFVASTTFAQTTLTPGTVSYSIEQGGKKLGAASYTIQNAPNKYLITSNGKIAQDKFSYAFSNTQKIDLSLNLIT